MPTDNSKLIYGGDLMLFMKSGSTLTPIAFSSSAKLSVSMKTREISSKDSGLYTEKMGGKFDWNCSTDGLLNYGPSGSTFGIDALYTMFQAQSGISMSFAVKTGSTPSWTVDATKKSFSGTCYITSFELNASDGETATYSISCEGSGLLTMA